MSLCSEEIFVVFITEGGELLGLNLVKKFIFPELSVLLKLNSTDKDLVLDSILIFKFSKILKIGIISNFKHLLILAVFF